MPGIAKLPIVISDILAQLGFTENEIRAYLTLVRFGEMPASCLARRVRMKRATAYSVLDSLQLRGLVLDDIGAKGRLFSAVDPVVILNMLEEELVRLNSLRRAVEGCVQAIRNMTLAD